MVKIYDYYIIIKIIVKNKNNNFIMGCDLCQDSSGEPLYGNPNTYYAGDGCYISCPGCTPGFDGFKEDDYKEDDSGISTIYKLIEKSRSEIYNKCKKIENETPNIKNIQKCLLCKPNSNCDIHVFSEINKNNEEYLENMFICIINIIKKITSIEIDFFNEYKTTVNYINNEVYEIIDNVINAYKIRMKSLYYISGSILKGIYNRSEYKDIFVKLQERKIEKIINLLEQYKVGFPH